MAIPQPLCGHLSSDLAGGHVYAAGYEYLTDVIEPVVLKWLLTMKCRFPNL